MKNIYLMTLSIAVILICCNCSAASSVLADEIYQCPMKCEGGITYNKPGKCPVCGMNLKLIKSADDSENSVVRNNPVKIAGAMMNVMHNGELFGTINLDTISNKEHLYGLGPVEYLSGEILIIDGRSYKSSVAADGSVKMEETFNVKAPFFVYENVDSWKEIFFPDSIQTIPELEFYLEQINKNILSPFAFKITATLDSAVIHIVNLPKGTEVKSPEDAHQNQKLFNLKNESVQLIGFFSKEHQGIFTHHDSYVHIHLITDDKNIMGHTDNFTLQKGTVKLFLPQNQ